MTTIPHDAERLPQAQREIEDLDVAVKFIDGQIQTETRIACNKLYEAVKSEVTRLGSIFAKAFLALHAAHLEFDQYVDKLEDAGGNTSTLRIRPNGLSHPRDLSGGYWYGLRDFIDAGFFSKSDLPKVFK
jgi:hypothetical protein